MKTRLRIDHGLFKKLIKNPPLWWINLKTDSDLYIDIRKDNYLNIYHNGGSIMKLEGASEITKDNMKEKATRPTSYKYIIKCMR